MHDATVDGSVHAETSGALGAVAVLVMACLAGGAVFGCAAGSHPAARASSSPTSQRYVTYRNARYHVAITYDSTRYFVVTGKSVHVAGADFTLGVLQRDAPSTSDPTNITGMTVSVVVQKRPRYLNDPDFAPRALYLIGIAQAQKFAATVHGNRNIIPKWVKLDGQPGFRFDMSGTANGSKRRWGYYQIYAPHASYVFSFGAPRADWAAREPDLDTMVHSFRVIK
jgi:hypothetical protein